MARLRLHTTLGELNARHCLHPRSPRSCANAPGLRSLFACLLARRPRLTSVLFASRTQSALLPVHIPRALTYLIATASALSRASGRCSLLRTRTRSMFARQLPARFRPSVVKIASRRHPPCECAHCINVSTGPQARRAPSRMVAAVAHKVSYSFASRSCNPVTCRSWDLGGRCRDAQEPHATLLVDVRVTAVLQPSVHAPASGKHSHMQSKRSLIHTPAQPVHTMQTSTTAHLQYTPPYKTSFPHLSSNVPLQLQRRPTYPHHVKVGADAS